MDEKEFFDKARKVAKDIDQGTYMKMENPYELADIIADPHRATYPYHQDIANMLRQQADEIGSLRARLKQLAEEMGCYKIELELHKAMIQDLERGLESSLALNKTQAERKASEQ
jgi:hypothetical protein